MGGEQTWIADNIERSRPGTSFVLLYLRNTITAGDSGDSHRMTRGKTHSAFVIDGTVCRWLSTFSGLIIDPAGFRERNLFPGLIFRTFYTFKTVPQYWGRGCLVCYVKTFHQLDQCFGSWTTSSWIHSLTGMGCDFGPLFFLLLLHINTSCQTKRLMACNIIYSAFILLISLYF